MGITFAQLATALVQGSRWTNAAKRKSLIRQAKCSLIANMSRRKANIRHWRSDVGHLLQIGQQDEAWSRVERLCREQFIVSAYAQLYQFCDCIYLKLDAMSKSKRHSELSNDVWEAVSSLIFAASRCGDLPELHSMRNMFKQYFGEEFERTCVELRPGNNVYPQIKEYLSRKLVVPADVKHQLLNDIAKEEIIPSLGTSYNRGQKLVPESQMAIYPKTNTPKTNTSNTSYSSASSHSAALPVQNESKDISVTKSHGLQNSSAIVAETQKRVKDLKPCLSHVHPNLPDYDDLVVKFKDIKTKSMQNYSNRNIIERLMGRQY
ncbi:hypothetical protein POM88_005483 [Heracleum sosnowskyi]|uniref:IST1 homolog n=1 Tax=Heracleum sosnowskyi TaxID=360622 RepID=A0AAD8J4I3_9APIA|nr:hypothetical protein POM88_005483 [Heracleum sosnowskyi]